MKAQKGDDKAFLKLFQTFEEDIYRMAFLYVKNSEDALDIVQETAYRSFKSIAKLKEPKYFKTWLLKIAINCALDFIRKEKKVIQLFPEYEGAIPNSEDEDVILTISLRELIEILNEEEKGIILLKFYHDHTLKEVAGILDLPLGTVKTILYRALNKLRREMKGDDQFGQ